VENPAAVRSPVEAVLLDAYGTLLDLPDPVPRLRALLAGAGHPHPVERVRAALRAEIAFYRAHHDRGRDPASLLALRRACAAVLAEGLGGDAPTPARLAPILVDSLRFTLFPDVLPALDALRAAGVRLAVVSNWDCSLEETLASLGVGDRFEAVAASAVVGAAKPDPAIFADALARLGVAPRNALHCGDLPEKDCIGAQRAGVRALLLDRHGSHAGGPCPVVRSLADLALLTSP
jgi:putative hydrolase of the HAD superfamily